MNTAKRNTVIAGVLVGVMGAAPCANGQSTARLTIDILADHGIPSATVAAATAVVGRLYRAVGIEIDWTGDGEIGSNAGATAPVVWRRIAIRSSAGKEFPLAFGNMGVLGVTPRGQGGPGRVVYVFYDAARIKSQRFTIPIRALLGYAMAHELGHSLLPHESHGEAGVMRAQWLESDMRLMRDEKLGFDPHDGSQIRIALLSAAGGWSR
jgi:hypothetical protein